MKKHSPVLITTEDFVLKSACGEHYNHEWFELLNREDVKHGLNLTHIEMTPAFCQALMESYDNHHAYLLGIYSLESNQLAGFYVIDVDLYNKKAIFSVAINNHIFKTVVWKTCDHFLDYFFDHRDVEKISARILENNRRVLYLFLVNGRFICEGAFKEDCLLPSGERVDTLVWSSFKNPRTYPVDFVRQ